MAQINDQSIPKTYELKIGNRIITKKGFQVLDSYQQMLKQYFTSRIDSLDLKSNPEAIRDSINDLLSRKSLIKF